MKLIVLQEKLKEGLNIVERIAAKSLTLPILNNILISTEKNFLKLSTTDLELGINWWSLTKIEKQGQITIPSRLFTSFINLLPNKKIALSIENNNLQLKCENYKTQIKGILADEFPIIPKIEKENSIIVSSSLFCRGLSQVADIAVLSTTKPEISGIYFFVDKEQITLAATDSFRLGEKKISFEKSSLKELHSLIFLQKTAKEIINIFGERQGNLNIYFSENQIMFESLMEETTHPHIQIISKLIEGEYPNYQEIIPKKYTTHLTIGKNELLNQIKTASLFSGKINEVKIKTNSRKQEIEIFSQAPDLGQYNSSVSGKIKGEDIQIAFNHRFLLDGLANIKSSEVMLELNGESGPGVLKPVGDQNYIYVVMPIKANQ